MYLVNDWLKEVCFPIACCVEYSKGIFGVIRRVGEEVFIRVGTSDEEAYKSFVGALESGARFRVERDLDILKVSWEDGEINIRVNGFEEEAGILQEVLSRLAD